MITPAWAGSSQRRVNHEHRDAFIPGFTANIRFRRKVFRSAHSTRRRLSRIGIDRRADITRISILLPAGNRKYVYAGWRTNCPA